MRILTPNRWWPAAVLALLLPTTAAAQEPPAAVAARSGNPLTADAAVAAALSDNPALAAMRARAAGLAEVPARAGALPDPRLQVGALNLPVDTFALDQEPMTQIQVGLSQMVPFPGKRPLMEAAAERDAAAAQAELAEARLALAGETAAAWWRLFETGRAIGIVRANRDLMGEFVVVARTKYEVGKGLQQDVLLAEVERSKLLDLALVLEGRREAQASALNALVGRPGGTPVRLPDEVDVALPDVASLTTLLDAGREGRPALAAAARRVEAADARLALAGKARRPDLMLSAAYGVRQGTNPGGGERPDFASVVVSLDLPLRPGTRQDREVAERRHQVAERAGMLDDARNRVAADVARLRAEYVQARGRARLFSEGILPQARQTVASMLAGYQVNKVDFLNLIRAQVTLYGYELDYWRVVAQARAARARLEAAVGGPLPEPAASDGEAS